MFHRVSKKQKLKEKGEIYKAFAYHSLFLRISEGLKAVPREPPPLVLWCRPCPGGPSEPSAGRAGLGQLPQRWLLNSRGGSCALVAFFLRGTESLHSWALASVRCLYNDWGWEVWLPQLPKKRHFSVVLQVLSCFSLSSLGPGCMRRKQMGLCWWVLYPPLAGAGKCANPCK